MAWARGLGSTRRYLPARRLAGARPGMGIAQRPRPPVQRQPWTPGPINNGTPRPPAAPNGYPVPSAPAPRTESVAYVGGAPGVYSYGITGSPGLSPNLDVAGIMGQLGTLNSQFNQLPLTPEMALGQAGLLSDFQNQMAEAQAGYGNTAAQANLAYQRLATDQSRANSDLGASMADRGVLERGSGLAAQGYANQAADFNRQRQDMTLATQEELARYQRMIQQALGGYGLGLSGLALQSARYSSGNPAYGTGARA